MALLQQSRNKPCSNITICACKQYLHILQNNNRKGMGFLKVEVFVKISLN
jgi:hypothetical protein